MPPAFRIYYADASIVDGPDLSGGATLTQAKDAWRATPTNGIAVVLVPDAVFGRFMLHGVNFYTWLPDGAPEDIYVSDDLGPLRSSYANLERDGWVKLGVLMPRAAFEAMLITAANDPVYPILSPRRRSTDRLARVISP